jgi:hypothetical protein
MTIWRWRHDRCPLPVFVLNALPALLQAKVAEAHQAQQDFRYFLAEPRVANRDTRFSSTMGPSFL